MKYFATTLGIVLVVTFSIVDAHGLWMPSSPQDLIEDSNTIFVGTVTDISNVERQYQSQISSNGTIKETVGPETIELEEYTVNVEEFLKNPQDTKTLKVLQATVGGVPGGPAKIRGFEIGERVLFYLPKDEKQTHFSGQYLPESFKIPAECDAKTVLSQPKIELRNSFEVMQEGIAKKDNFTAGIPMKFVLSRDMDDLGGRSLDVSVSIRPYGEDNVVFEKNVHAESKQCIWIASAEWEFTPKEGNYRMYINARENDASRGSESYTGFSVIPEQKTDISPNTENIDGQLFKVIGPFALRPQSDDTINFDGVKFSYPYYPVPITPGGVQSVDISFEDGIKEHIGTVGPPDPFLKFTEHEDPIGGVRRNSDGTFDFLLGVDGQSVFPLKQAGLGIPPNEIQCKNGLTLIQKYDSSPACVKYDTKPILIKRGWMKIQVDVFDEKRFIDSAKKVEESKIFLSHYPDAKITVDPDRFLVKFEESGYRQHPSSIILYQTKRLNIGLDYDGRPTVQSLECGGGGVTLDVSSNMVNKFLKEPDWCFPLDQSSFKNMASELSR